MRDLTNDIPRRYFASANTVGGFVSYYDDVFGDCRSVYIIKGGSGTGKSRLMKEVGARAEKLGREVEYFHCSFDPSSVDGIIINGKTAIVDGTSPHTYDPTLPGARENIINLGAFLRVDKLKRNEKKLFELLKEKKNCFDMAYSYLSAVQGLENAKAKTLQKYINRDKIKAIAEETIENAERVDNARKKVRSISAIGKNGIAVLGDLSHEAKRIMMLNDKYGVGYTCLEAIISEATRRSIPITVSYSPIFKHRPDSLIVGDLAVVLNSKSTDNYLVSELSDDDENELLSLQNMCEEMEQNATRWFQNAAENHFSIEEIYTSAMDFDKKDKFTQKLINALGLQ
jgi:hypothetical protein